MKIVLILVGKTVGKELIRLTDDYADRVKHYMPFEIVTIPELKNTKALTAEQQKTAEGEMIQRQLQGGDYVVLLDEHGKEMRSIEFASWIARKSNTVSKRLVFVVGGPYGFSPAVYHRADEQISMSQMTFSHQMIRLLFTEQLYRAMTIIKNEPYHHE